MKKILLILLLSVASYGQIKIDDIGDGWKYKIEEALDLVKTYDIKSYDVITNNCNHITFWLSTFSSIQDSSTILVSVNDIKLNSINNLACVLVHEAHHLKIKHDKVILSEYAEEAMCYNYEFNFLSKLPNVEPWLKEHAIKMEKYYSSEHK
jgi:hypothetical protein